MYKNEIVLLENLKYKKSYAISASHFDLSKIFNIRFYFISI